MNRPSTHLILAIVATTAACSGSATPLELAGPPAVITAVSGTVYAGARGAELPDIITVRVRDADGRPAPAVAVRWTASRGTVTAVNDSTDEAGISRARWTLPASEGTDALTASVEGIGAVAFAASVQPIPGTIVYRYLDAGSYHACGITTTEELICWGYNADGQLGLATSAPKPFPTLIPGDQRYRLVSGGRYHACAVTLAGKAVCWGDNRDGKTTAPEPPSYRAIHAGRVHTCALTLANELDCWGWNGEGQTAGNGYGWSSVNVNGLHSCGITDAGAAQCWGFNASGQLGRGTTSTQEAPGAVSGGITWRTDPTVVPPAPDPDFPLPDGPFIGTGFAHTCALRSDGAAFCWGINQDGQLGDGTRTQRLSPAAVSGGLTFARITTGDRHSCAITSAGVAYCWGDNTFGQLGDGTTTDRLTPIAIAGGLTFAYLKAGELFTCGVTAAGVAHCWGDNEYGQLGDGTTASQSVPTKVAFQP